MAIVMSMKRRLSLLLVLICLSAAGWFVLRGDSHSRSDKSDDPHGEQTAEGARARSDSSVDVGAERLVGSQESPKDSRERSAGSWQVRGVCVDERRRPLEGVRLWLSVGASAAEARGSTPGCITGPDGRFGLPTSDGMAAHELHAECAGFHP